MRMRSGEVDWLVVIVIVVALLLLGTVVELVYDSHRQSKALCESMQLPVDQLACHKHFSGLGK